ncbi:PAS domain-containing protein [Sphingomonas sp. RHCKR47]|uniref:two-component system sensor histidine kinase NtrB n=1 Tax=Sphingomonas citricola TaxID=2862498 RepID=UPI001CA5884A|nr:ATP-binding protein [Sphingomonas citricola]MBW6523590.1 PAS domain-containing protein [Sphingomonas citricola]
MLAARDPSDADLIAALPVATLAIGPDDRIARVNAEAETLLNMSQRALLGRRLDEVLTGASGAARRSDHAAAIFDTAVTTARGLSLRVDLVEAEMPDRPGWRLLTLHNVAPSRRLGQGIDRAAARSAVGAAAMLAHEIKNPLSSIRGAAQLIADGAAAGELCGLVIKEVDRIAALIDRMEDFTDTRPCAVSAINIYPLLAHSRDVALAGFARGITVEERYDPSLPLALGNHDALLQVMLNLLKNAAAALDGSNERRITLATAYRHGITVAAREGGGRVALPIEICVIDTGPGAPDDIAEHLFDPFVSSRPEGKGLGLALVDKLIRDMGGLVQYAREGHPATTVFRILLPRAH